MTTNIIGILLFFQQVSWSLVAKKQKAYPNCFSKEAGFAGRRGFLSEATSAAAEKSSERTALKPEWERLIPGYAIRSFLFAAFAHVLGERLDLFQRLSHGAPAVPEGVIRVSVKGSLEGAHPVFEEHDKKLLLHFGRRSFYLALSARPPG